VVIQLIIAACLGIGAIVKAGEVTRATQDRFLPAMLATCLGLLAVGYLLSDPPVTQGLDHLVATGFGKIAYNSATFAGLAVLLMFFEAVTLGISEARSRVRLEVVLVVLVIAVTVALMVATPAQFRGHTLSSPYI